MQKTNESPLVCEYGPCCLIGIAHHLYTFPRLRPYMYVNTTFNKQLQERMLRKYLPPMGYNMCKYTRLWC